MLWFPWKFWSLDIPSWSWLNFPRKLNESFFHNKTFLLRSSQILFILAFDSYKFNKYKNLRCVNYLIGGCYTSSCFVFVSYMLPLSTEDIICLTKHLIGSVLFVL